MKKLLFGLVAILSLSSFAHNLPDDVMKAELIKVMVKHKKPLASILKEDLEQGVFYTSFAERHLIPVVNFYEWGFNGYDKTGDQDLEEFHFSFQSNDKNYELNCLLRSAELLSKTNGSVKYELKPAECVLRDSDGASRDVFIPNATHHTNGRY